MSPAEKLEILIMLAQDSDPALRDTARQTLLTMPPRSLAAFLTTSAASPDLLRFFAEKSTTPEVVRAILAQPATPAESVVALVERLPGELLAEFLAKEPPEIVAPALIGALEGNPHHTAATKERLEEWRLGLLAAEAEAAEKDVQQKAEPEEEKESERITVQQKIVRLAASQKVQLALKGTKEERSILIRDGNKVVARAVLMSPKISDGEVEGFAALKNVQEEVLRTIVATRRFNKNYNIVRALINNPRTPLDVSLKLMQRLNIMDLKMLSGNRNLPETLRSAALKLLKQRTAPPSGGGGGGH